MLHFSSGRLTASASLRHAAPVACSRPVISGLRLLRPAQQVCRTQQLDVADSMELAPMPAVTATAETKASQRQKQTTHQLKVRDLVHGVVISSAATHAWVAVDGVECYLRIHNVSNELVGDVSRLLKPQDKIKALVVSCNREAGTVELNTKHLEPASGDMVKDPQMVFDKAEETAAAWRAAEEVKDHGERADRRKFMQALGIKTGDVVEGKVISTHSFGAFVTLSPNSGSTEGSVDSLLPSSSISRMRCRDARPVFTVGEDIKALVVEVDMEALKIRLSTKLLETSAGDMLRDKQAVYDKAEEMGANYRQSMQA